MIWEVDEDCDQGLNWAEFQAMYHRCNNDKTGEQPVLLICCVACILTVQPVHILLQTVQPVHILLQGMSLGGSSTWSSLS